jgi:cell wall-associated NlpC family hydrolase
MSAFRPGVAAALALSLLGCASAIGRMRHARLPPPAREIRAGALTRSAGPDSGSRSVIPSPATERATGDRRRAVAAASALVGRRTIVVGTVDYGTDCAALVRAAFDQAGRPLPSDVRDAPALYAYAVRRGALDPLRRAVAGDVLFLADRPGGLPAHVALVARTNADGTALVLHRVARGVQRLRVNLTSAERQSDPLTGRRLNDALLVGGHPVPAGRLVVAVADLLRDAR